MAKHVSELEVGTDMQSISHALWVKLINGG